jgi:hypothetical protein
MIVLLLFGATPHVIVEKLRSIFEENAIVYAMPL